MKKSKERVQHEKINPRLPKKSLAKALLLGTALAFGIVGRNYGEEVGETEIQSTEAIPISYEIPEEENYIPKIIENPDYEMIMPREREPKINVETRFNFSKTENKINVKEYSSMFSTKYDVLAYPREEPLITREEAVQIETVLKDLKYGKISSYEEFISSFKGSSEAEKLSLAATLSYLSKFYGYNLSSLHSKVGSQEEFFEKIKKMLNEDKTNMGVCSHINYYIERLLNTLDIKSASAMVTSSEDNHMITLSSLDEKMAIIDYSAILIGDTNNPIKLLRIYQQESGMTSFYHPLYEDGKLRLIIIPPEGKEFLNSFKHDKTLGDSKEKIIQRGKNSPKWVVETTNGEFVDSTITNYNQENINAFGGIGTIKNLPGLEGMIMAMGGVGGSFPFLRKMKIDGGISLLRGFPSEENLEGKTLYGLRANMTLRTDNAKGLNFLLSERVCKGFIGKNILNVLSSPITLFYQVVTEAGISYTSDLKKDTPNSFTPYAFSQFSLENDGTNNPSFIPTEFHIGTLLEFHSGIHKFLIDPHYVWKIGSQEFALDLIYESPNFNIEVNGSGDISNYIFAPTVFEFDLKTQLKMQNLLFTLGIDNSTTIYPGERENQTSLVFGFSY